MKRMLIALFALCAATGVARAQQVIVIQPDAAAAARQALDERVAAERAADERAAAERRQRMIDRCIANHGYEEDCVREVDTELRAEGARVIHLRAPH